MRRIRFTDTSSKALSQLGMLKLYFRCDRASAENALSHALKLNPGDMRALDYHSYYLLEIGRTDEAIAEKRKVLEHDPLRAITNAELGLYLFLAGRTDEAIEQLQKTLELVPNYAAAHARLGVAYAAKEQYREAVTELQKALSLDKKPDRLARLGEVYARWGKRHEALEMIRQLREMSKQTYVSPTMIAQIYARLGAKKATMAGESYCRRRSKNYRPGFESLRSEPGFKVMEARLRSNPSCPAF